VPRPSLYAKIEGKAALPDPLKGELAAIMIPLNLAIMCSVWMQQLVLHTARPQNKSRRFKTKTVEERQQSSQEAYAKRLLIHSRG
jgi:hypothetical protein